jgi:hypothetical protein
LPVCPKELDKVAPGPLQVRLGVRLDVGSHRDVGVDERPQVRLAIAGPRRCQPFLDQLAVQLRLDGAQPLRGRRSQVAAGRVRLDDRFDVRLDGLAYLHRRAAHSHGIGLPIFDEQNPPKPAASVEILAT